MAKKTKVPEPALSKKENSLRKDKKGAKVEEIVLKKKKNKFNPLKVEKKSEDVNKIQKKLIANIQRPKEQPSSNWKSFLSLGLAGQATSVPQKGKESKPFKFERNRKETKSKDVHAIPDFVTAAPVPTLDHRNEDAYVSNLAPKSEKEKHALTRCIAMDCEMVGVYDGKQSVLARVSLVNQYGECVYDKFVKTKEEVADYRTKVSGVRPDDLKHGTEFEIVQKEVAAILKDKILVGHALRNDLKVLMLNHHPRMIRDTSRFKPFRKVVNGRTPALKKLASEILGVAIQSGEHSSVEDAKAAMQLYNLYQKEWEGHRLQKKVNRREKAIAATAGNSRVLQITADTVATSKNPLVDEFAAF